MPREKLQAILQKHIPSQAAAYCFQLWEKSPFHFKLRKRRQTKVGDFSCMHGHTPQITVNEDLHPFLFLITYIHEVAHLEVHRQCGNTAEAHGEEWKNAFRKLLDPVMTLEIFPAALMSALTRHMVNPMASTFSDTGMTQLLRGYDPRWSKSPLLSEIPEGSLFGFHGRWFKKGKLQRTRVLCQELKTKRKFLVPADVPVEGAQLSFL